jgi:hypothetical protein
MSRAPTITYWTPPAPREVIQAFHDAGLSDSKIALLISAHAGRWISPRTVAGIRRGEPKYSARNIAEALHDLARVWRIGIVEARP